jgi:hypothetical protein
MATSAVISIDLLAKRELIGFIRLNFLYPSVKEPCRDKPDRCDGREKRENENRSRG